MSSSSKSGINRANLQHFVPQAPSTQSDTELTSSGALGDMSPMDTELSDNKDKPGVDECNNVATAPQSLTEPTEEDGAKRIFYGTRNGGSLCLKMAVTRKPVKLRRYMFQVGTSNSSWRLKCALVNSVLFCSLYSNM